MPGLAAARAQLFAEACARYRAGGQWWPDRDWEAAHVQPEQEARYEADAWEGVVADFLRGRARVTVLEVAAEALGVDKARLGLPEQRRVWLAWSGRGGSGGSGAWADAHTCPGMTGMTAPADIP